MSNLFEESVFFLLFDLRSAGKLSLKEGYIAYKSVIHGYKRLIGSSLPSDVEIRRNTSKVKINKID